jgi:hypothetical protein
LNWNLHPLGRWSRDIAPFEGLEASDEHNNPIDVPNALRIE